MNDLPDSASLGAPNPCNASFPAIGFPLITGTSASVSGNAIDAVRAKVLLPVALPTLLAFLLITPQAVAQHQHPASHDPHAHHTMPAQPSSVQARPVDSLSVPDTLVTDQHGHQIHFDELTRDRTVAINFIFTTCTTICPPMGATFGQLESLLDQSGDDTALISVSVDPVVDTPERLAAWAARFHAGDRWTLVTGQKPEIDRLLKKLRVFTPDKIDHAPIVLLGDTQSGRWLRANALAPPAQLAESLRSLAAEPPATDPKEDTP